MSFKSVDTLTTEQLIAIASEPDENKPIPKSDVTEFLDQMRFKRGQKRIPFWFLLNLYRMWSSRPMRSSELARELRRRFIRSRTKFEVYYHLRAPHLKLKR